ncbi:heme o synthase [Alkalihalobacillus pseudalcaliphilus]|uniref:heme o synthase n=1 Tax=Alkalihalobacillus pseudalcaliphilus TaxID=79884 RepID=UPI00064DE401|nr:heme o synthase [Alkalihalobacillus pseudalcaliphilus]KMK77082.1 protoheme IX farnesyltransferase [Alkalihalobacillus pseudalcaliphilus]
MNKTDSLSKSGEVVQGDTIAAPMSQSHSWKDYLVLAKQGIVTSNLITTFTGVFLAAIYTSTGLAANWQAALFAILGSGLVMAGACTFNNYIDRDIDPIMERTKNRPSVTGRFSGKHILTVGAIQSIIGLIFLSLTTATAAIIGAIGLFIYVVLYSMWTKRTTTLNTIVGSFSGAVPPLIGWAAIDGSLHMYAWLLFFIMFFWQPPHFLALAMRRVDEYRAAGIPMLPVVAGFEMTKRQIVIYVAALLPVSLLLYPFGIVYTVVAAILGVGWLALGISGFKAKDDLKWAKQMFVYSLNYLTILFVLMVIVHL